MLTRFFSGQLNGFLRFCGCVVELSLEITESCGVWFGGLRLRVAVTFFLLRSSSIVSAGFLHLGGVAAIADQYSHLQVQHNINFSVT